MYGINREKVVTPFKSDYIIKMLLVEKRQDCIVQPATVSLQGNYDRGKILTIYLAEVRAFHGR